MIGQRLRDATVERGRQAVRTTGVLAGALGFVIAATLIVAFDSLLPGGGIANLQLGDIAPQDIRAPFDWRYESRVLTERRRAEAMANTPNVYDPPDPNVARQQVALARAILDYVDNVRRDPFGTPEQKRRDLEQVTSLTLDAAVLDAVVAVSGEAWSALDDEIVTVLERLMREQLRESDLPGRISQLPTQVSVRFTDADAAIVIAIVEDLLRPNTFLNPVATEAARQTAAENTPSESRVFERGQIVVREGARIEAVELEALTELGLLQTDDRRLQNIVRALLASSIVAVLIGTYIVRLRRDLLDHVRYFLLLIAIFLIVLIGARLFSVDSQLYIYPTAALALILVALATPDVAIVAVLGMALLVGIMVNRSLEASSLVIVGGVMGALTLQRGERLNSFFLAGLAVAVANVAVVLLFNLDTPTVNLGILVVYALVNGIFAAAVALAGMYVVTILFNLPTSLKLVELSQPNQPLLQRLLREAPGTYQHSLQVANLSEQAANAIGANAELVRVAALYHDIGKILNPAFFVENQADNVNPHDVLNDPYRSADIIISHVVDGERLARQYYLPARVRDFIMEHHGTTLVSYFYRQALDAADDQESVDVDQFTYPGPKPQSRETAIMMLADSCESTVRARKPTNRQEIVDIVGQIVDARQREAQLDDSGLTANDIKTIRIIFVEMLQAVFHPRINYPSLQPGTQPAALGAGERTATGEVAAVRLTGDGTAPTYEAKPGAPNTAPRPERPYAGEGGHTAPTPPAVSAADDTPSDDADDSPMPDVPPLRRTSPVPRPPESEKGE